MTDDKNDLTDEAEGIRAETAAEAPELAEHDRVAELEKALEEAKAKSLYAAAELQNTRRRMEKEMIDARQYAAAGFARDMLSIKDHLDRALAAVGEEISAAGCSLLLIVVSPAIVGSILVKHGTPEQKDHWLRGIAAGTTKVAFAITEPAAGS